jgi:hypothetical protein
MTLIGLDQSAMEATMPNRYFSANGHTRVRGWTAGKSFALAALILAICLLLAPALPSMFR